MNTQNGDASNWRTPMDGELYDTRSLSAHCVLPIAGAASKIEIMDKPILALFQQLQAEHGLLRQWCHNNIREGRWVNAKNEEVDKWLAVAGGLHNWLCCVYWWVEEGYLLERDAVVDMDAEPSHRLYALTETEAGERSITAWIPAFQAACRETTATVNACIVTETDANRKETIL